MKTYDLQDIDLNVTKDKAFSFISDANNLPRWTNAFTSINKDRAVMQTPGGEVEIGLEVHASAEFGTVDWPSILDKIRQFEDTRRISALYRSHSMPTPSDEFLLWLRKVIKEPGTISLNL